MITLWHLFYEFFKIGLFSFGGGYATIPFLYELVHTYGWYSASQLTNMIAVSMITPGPVGANMATFAGFQTYGVLGGILATLALVLPSYLLVIFVSKILKEYKDKFLVKSILSSLKPAGCGLLCSVGCSLFKSHVNSVYAFCLFIFLFLISFKFKKNPLYYFLFASIIAIVLQLFGVKFD
ncbi:chromate transporter [bacterium]|nr:chromate transporter [bacterium]